MTPEELKSEEEPAKRQAANRPPRPQPRELPLRPPMPSDDAGDEAFAVYWKDYDAWRTNVSEPDWEPYRGNHHTSVPDPGCRWGGSISFKKHIEKPLSQALWIDITQRLGVFNLRVYREGDWQWCDTWANITIYVNDADVVKDIAYVPPGTLETKGEPGKFKIYQRLGPTIGHTAGLERANFT